MSCIHYLLPSRPNLSSSPHHYPEFFSPSLSTSADQCDLPGGWMAHLILSGVSLLVTLPLLGHGCCNFLFIAEMVSCHCQYSNPFVSLPIYWHKDPKVKLAALALRSVRFLLCP